MHGICNVTSKLTTTRTVCAGTAMTMPSTVTQTGTRSVEALLASHVPSASLGPHGGCVYRLGGARLPVEAWPRSGAYLQPDTAAVEGESNRANPDLFLFHATVSEAKVCGIRVARRHALHIMACSGRGACH